MKKNNLKRAAAILAAISLMMSAVPTEASAEESMSIVALGDSITTLFRSSLQVLHRMDLPAQGFWNSFQMCQYRQQ